MNLRVRCNAHFALLRRGVHDNIYLQNAWNKYGESSFEFVIIEYVMPFMCLDREQYWLDKLKPFGKIGYNGNRIADKPPSAKGRTASTSTRQKISESAKNKPPVSDETRQKLSNAHKGKPLTKEHRQKMSEARKGRIHNAEARQKMSEAGSRYYIITNPDGIEFDVVGLKQFCIANSLYQSCMTRVAQGKVRQHKGWKCRYG